MDLKLTSTEPTTVSGAPSARPKATVHNLFSLISFVFSVVRKVSGGLDPECEEVGEQLFAFLISLLHR